MARFHIQNLESDCLDDDDGPQNVCKVKISHYIYETILNTLNGPFCSFLFSELNFKQIMIIMRIIS